MKQSTLNNRRLLDSVNHIWVDKNCLIWEWLMLWDIDFYYEAFVVLTDRYCALSTLAFCICSVWLMLQRQQCQSDPTVSLLVLKEAAFVDLTGDWRRQVIFQRQLRCLSFCQHDKMCWWSHIPLFSVNIKGIQVGKQRKVQHQSLKICNMCNLRCLSNVNYGTQEGLLPREFN